MTIYIKADATTGNISSILTITDPSHIAYAGAVPLDLYATFALGHYTFDGINIITTPNWVAPPAPVLPTFPV